MKNETQRMDPHLRGDQLKAKEMLRIVHDALVHKGYNPYTQLVGYILSGDPTYITSHDNARALICKIERDELLESLIRDFLCDTK